MVGPGGVHRAMVPRPVWHGRADRHDTRRPLPAGAGGSPVPSSGETGLLTSSPGDRVDGDGREEPEGGQDELGGARRREPVGSSSSAWSAASPAPTNDESIPNAAGTISTPVRVATTERERSSSVAAASRKG